LLKKRCRIENDFDFGYDRALNEVMYHLMEVSPEEERCAECAVRKRTRTTVDDVLEYLFCVLQDMSNHSSEDDSLQGYERAIGDLVYQVWNASPESAGAQMVIIDEDRRIFAFQGDGREVRCH
jgi:hypothetical protein